MDKRKDIYAGEDHVVGRITKSSPLALRRLALQFHDELKLKEFRHPGRLDMFDEKYDDGYRVYLLRSGGEWVGAACFRETGYIDLYRCYMGEGDPPPWCLQWACLDRVNNPLLIKALLKWEREMPRYLILDVPFPSMQRIVQLSEPEPERVMQAGYDQLAWFPPEYRRKEQRYWGTYRRKPGGLCLC